MTEAGPHRESRLVTFGQKDGGITPRPQKWTEGLNRREKTAVNVLECPARISSFLENEWLSMTVGISGVVWTLWSSGTAFPNLT